MNDMKEFDQEDRMERLLESKTFQQLNDEERTLVLKALGSEEQYNAMRRVTLALITSKVDLSPDPQTLQSLENKMDQEKKNSWSNILTFRVPAYAALLLTGVVAALVTLILSPREKLSTRIVEVVKRDTVIVTRVDIDTVYRDRFIYKRVQQEFPADKNYLRVVKKITIDEAEPETGVSMKDKQELETLLVSGSE
jgi:hypothetical protein